MVGGTEWGERDHLLIFAYQRYLDTICPECGGYMLECRNPANQGVYEVNTDLYCYRKEALEDTTRAEKFKAENGQVFNVKEIDASLVSRAPLPLNGGQHSAQVSDHDEGNSGDGKK